MESKLKLENDLVYKTNKLNHCWLDLAWLWGYYEAITIDTCETK